MKKRISILAAFALAVAVLGTALPQALAYFTTYTDAAGVKTLQFTPETEIEEPSVEDWTKTVQISNTGEAAVYVRAIAYAPDGMTLATAVPAGHSAPMATGTMPARSNRKRRRRIF